MKEMENTKSNTTDRELCLTRTLDAPIELVWEVWTQPGHIAKWWGPNGFTNTISKMIVEPGGEWELVMHGPDGTDYKNKSIFKEIIPLKKIVYDHVTSPKFVTTIEFELAHDFCRDASHASLFNWVEEVCAIIYSLSWEGVRWIVQWQGGVSTHD
jgi:hypothetical protein